MLWGWVERDRHELTSDLVRSRLAEAFSWTDDLASAYLRRLYD